MREQLKRFSDFDALPAAVLDTVAGSARRLRVPARRWLVRAGRSLSGRFYLLEGRVQVIEAGRPVIVNAGSARARRAVYPGATGVETLTSALFLRVDSAQLDSAGTPATRSDLGVPEVQADQASWQRRFLTSPLMQRFDPLAWQRILRAMEGRQMQAGEHVIRAGEGAECCYVLRAGAAEIRDGAGRVLATLAPGSLFGEDALVSGGVRNASVIMTATGSVMSLAADDFQTWLLDVVARPLHRPDGRHLIGLEPRCGAALWIPVAGLRGAAARLSATQAYAVVGGSVTARALAAFLLAEQGIDARPVGSPAAVRPAPCGPEPSA